MTIIDKQVIISDKSALSFQARLLADHNEHIFKLDLFSNDFDLLNIQGVDFFDCLLKLRQLLEQKGLFILCQGSVTTVYLSGMARDMSDGLKAYSLELGKKASLDQLIEIFDSADIETVGTIAEQITFFEKWVKTPKH